MKQSKLPFPLIKRKADVLEELSDDSQDEYDSYIIKNKKKIIYSNAIIVDVFSNKKGLIKDIFSDPNIADTLPKEVACNVYEPVLEAFDVLRKNPSVPAFQEYEEAYKICVSVILANSVWTTNEPAASLERTVMMPYGTFFAAMVVMYDAYIRKIISYNDFKCVRDHVLNKKGSQSVTSVRNAYINNYYLELYRDYENPQNDNDNMDMTLLEYIKEIPKLMSIFTDRRTASQTVSFNIHWDMKKMKEYTDKLLESVKEEDFISFDKF